MPIIKRGNDFIFDYKIPKRKKNLMTKEFLQTFKDEIDNVFSGENYPEVKQRNYWNFYFNLENTGGFYEALKLACKKYNLVKAIYMYACKMPWHDSDLFDDELVSLMIKHGIIEEGKIEDYGEEYDYENDKDFELVITEEKLKDCTIIHKDWILTKECKDRLGIKY